VLTPAVLAGISGILAPVPEFWPDLTMNARAGGEILHGILEEWCRGVAVMATADKIGTITSSFNNFIRTGFVIGKFSNFTSSGITLNLDTGHNKIANSKCDGTVEFVDVFMTGCMVFFGEEVKDLLGEAGGGSTETEKGMDIRSLIGHRG
jgi:hypothetical protein